MKSYSELLQVGKASISFSCTHSDHTNKGWLSEIEKSKQRYIVDLMPPQDSYPVILSMLLHSMLEFIVATFSMT